MAKLAITSTSWELKHTATDTSLRVKVVGWHLVCRCEAVPASRKTCDANYTEDF